MNSRELILVSLICGLILLAGCVSPEPVSSVHTQPASTNPPVQTLNIPPAASGGESDPGSPHPAVPGSEMPLQGPVSGVEEIIALTFPAITEQYTAIQRSRNALEWDDVQAEALSLQVNIQELMRSYQMDRPNPAQRLVPGIDSREEIVLLKYIRFLEDMGYYAENLKNAVYYQEKGSDPPSAQTARRYQGIADQYEKQAINAVQTISDYCDDFSIRCFDKESASLYRHT